MACAKPPNPEYMTDPEVSHDPAIGLACQCLEEVLDAVRSLPPGAEFSRELARAQSCVDRAIRSGVSDDISERLNGKLRAIESEAANTLRLAGTNPEGAPPPRTSSSGRDLPPTWSPRPVAPVVCDALTQPTHLMHRAITERLMTFVAENQALSQSYKDQLPKDIVEVLKVAPDALGLVKEAVHRGQRQPLASAGKIGRGTGTAYELMGTAAIIRKGSPSTLHHGPPLHIVSRDRLDFGIKLQASYPDDERKLFQSRKTIEADVLIYRPPPEPNVKAESPKTIAVDFKHVKHGSSYSDKSGTEKTKAGESFFAKQLAGVFNALKTDEIQEFHFVTNGHFSASFRDAVDEMNKKLVGHDLPPISLHEHVIAEGCKPRESVLSSQP